MQLRALLLLLPFMGDAAAASARPRGDAQASTSPLACCTSSALFIANAHGSNSVLTFSPIVPLPAAPPIDSYRILALSLDPIPHLLNSPPLRRLLGIANRRGELQKQDSMQS